MSSDETITRLNKFRGFKAGWHHGEGVPFGHHFITMIRKLHEFAHGLGLKTDVFPRTDGTLILCVYYKEGCLEFVAELDYTFSLDREIGVEVVESHTNLSFAQAAKIIRDKVKSKPSPFPLPL